MTFYENLNLGICIVTVFMVFCTAQSSTFHWLDKCVSLCVTAAYLVLWSYTMEITIDDVQGLYHYYSLHNCLVACELTALAILLHEIFTVNYYLDLEAKGKPWIYYTPTHPTTLGELSPSP